MTPTTKTYHGFAIPLQPDTDLGLAVLIAENDDGQHEPIAVIGTISEARGIAESDFRGRMRLIERDEDAGLCPTRYKVWARGMERRYILAAELDDIL